MSQALSWQVLELDLEAEATRIAARLREVLSQTLRRRGLVVAISGGIDSSCCLALAARAVGAGRVHALILPERDSSDDSAVRGRLLAKHLRIDFTEQDIAPTLEAIGCYHWRDGAIRRAIPDYGANWKMKIVIAGGLEGQVNRFNIVARSPDGKIVEQRLALADYLQIVAATNFKQRIRKALEYFHADRLNYAVVGTPNRLEYDQGFYVKNGDGAADVKPIAHLYKTQVYAMARHLGLPERICAAVPTTDTYSLPQGQDEFYFALPYREMDLALWSRDHDVAPMELARMFGIEEQRARHIYADIDAKRRASQYLGAAPIIMAESNSPC